MPKSLKCTAGILCHEYKGYILEKCDAGHRNDEKSSHNNRVQSRLRNKAGGNSLASIAPTRRQISYWRIRDPQNPYFLPEHERTLKSAKIRVRVLFERKNMNIEAK